MEFRAVCQCGQSIAVSLGQAGSAVDCRCGASVSVPSLRELRSAAGLPPPEHPELAVKRLLQSGCVRDGPCAVCGAQAGAVLYCVAECERSVRKSEAHWLVNGLAIVLAALISPWLLFFRESRSEEPRFLGRDLILRLPLPVCPVCRRGLTNQAEVVKALCHLPEYRRLLQKYPHAKVQVDRSSP
jgi:hypothetical protein